MLLWVIVGYSRFLCVIVGNLVVLVCYYVWVLLIKVISLDTRKKKRQQLGTKIAKTIFFWGMS